MVFFNEQVPDLDKFLRCYNLTDVAMWNIIINEAHRLLTVWAFRLALELELSHVANGVHTPENSCCHFTSLLVVMDID